MHAASDEHDSEVVCDCAESGAEGEEDDGRDEQPLATETWRQQSEDTQDRTWVKSGVRPVMYVTDPYAVVKITGLAA